MSHFKPSRLGRHLTVALSMLGLVVSLWSGAGCDGDDDGGGEPKTVVDAGQVDSGQPDTGCPWYPFPNCPEGQHAVQDPPPPGCEEGPWHCEDCPDPAFFHTCPPGQSHQMDENGCLADRCDCTITTPPDCPEGQVPQYYGEVDGKRCLTGACGPDCPPVEEPECGIYEQVERDHNGCPTGRCVPIPCAPVEPPDCGCYERPAHNPAGCLTGVCEPEPQPCTITEVPPCPEGKVPEVERGSACLTGQCISGACIDKCDSDQDCASSDECRPYAPGCDACFPKVCEDFTDCFYNTDCVDGHCRLREVAQCTTDDDCDGGLVCDSPTCGGCEPSCACNLDEDCPIGTICEACACMPGCRSDLDCTLPQRCNLETGQCDECSCSEDTDCPGDRFCDGCFCLSGCREDAQCPPWQICDLSTHQCKDGIQCHQDRDCGSSLLCVDGRCVRNPGVCEGDAPACEPYFDDCICDYVCVHHGEAPEACGFDCDDALRIPPPMCVCQGDQCDYGRCDGDSGQTCPAAYHCSKPNQGSYDVRTPGICREGRPPARLLCRTDEDCVPEECCAPTMCVNREHRACETTVDCDSGTCRLPITGCGCVDGVCVTTYDRSACQD